MVEGEARLQERVGHVGGVGHVGVGSRYCDGRQTACSADWRILETVFCTGGRLLVADGGRVGGRVVAAAHGSIQLPPPPTAVIILPVVYIRPLVIVICSWYYHR